MTLWWDICAVDVIPRIPLWCYFSHQKKTEDQEELISNVSSASLCGFKDNDGSRKIRNAHSA